MKNLIDHINEKLQIGSNTKLGDKYSYHPKDINELSDIIDELIKERGNNADLNDIDTSEITDMSYLFHKSKFNGDISGWDVSNVKNMESMFANSKFNGDISQWDVSNVTDMYGMFYASKFNGDISNWNINKDADMRWMFNDCPLKKNPPKWYKK